MGGIMETTILIASIVLIISMLTELTIGYLIVIKSNRDVIDLVGEHAFIPSNSTEFKLIDFYVFGLSIAVVVMSGFYLELSTYITLSTMGVLLSFRTLVTRSYYKMVMNKDLKAIMSTNMTLEKMMANNAISRIRLNWDIRTHHPSGINRKHLYVQSITVYSKFNMSDVNIPMMNGFISVDGRIVKLY